MRLAKLVRETPDVPASSEFSAYELEAIIALRQPKNAKDGPPSLLQVVRWVAEIGGHPGRWGGVPGVTTIGRGLRDVVVVAQAFEARDKM